MIRRWLSFFHATRLPRPREIPIIFLKVVSFGAVVGIAFSLAYTLLAHQSIPPDRILDFFAFSAALGAIFSLSFYVTCGLPGMILPDLVSHLPETRRRILIAIAGGIDATLGLMLAAWAVTHLPFRREVRIAGEDYFGIILVVDAILGAVISTVILALARAREQTRRSREELLEARFSALQSQINPHFLFNTLNSISALVTRRPEAAQEMIGRLADMFRYALDSQSEMVTLEQELDFVRHYLALEQVRFSDRLEVRLPSGDFRGIRIPGLTLQPVLENAVRYGIANRIEGGAIEMTVQREHDRCQVVVRNQFDAAITPDLSDARIFRSGHALYNIRERLRIQWYGRTALRVERDGEEWVRTVIDFPVEA